MAQGETDRHNEYNESSWMNADDAVSAQNKRDRRRTTSNHIKQYMETRKRQRRPEMRDERKVSENPAVNQDIKSSSCSCNDGTTAHHGQTRQSRSITCSHQPAVGILSQLKDITEERE